MQPTSRESDCNKFMRCTALLVVTALATLSLGTAQAADRLVSAGASRTASNLWTPVVYADLVGSRRPLGGIAWQPVASLGALAARDARSDMDRNVVVGSAGVRLVDWWRQAFFSFQVGLASSRTAAVSSRGQFVSSVGWEGEHHVVTVRHISNGNIDGGENLGETMLLLGWRF